MSVTIISAHDAFERLSALADQYEPYKQKAILPFICSLIEDSPHAMLAERKNYFYRFWYHFFEKKEIPVKIGDKDVVVKTGDLSSNIALLRELFQLALTDKTKHDSGELKKVIDVALDLEKDFSKKLKTSTETTCETILFDDFSKKIDEKKTIQGLKTLFQGEEGEEIIAKGCLHSFFTTKRSSVLKKHDAALQKIENDALDELASIKGNRTKEKVDSIIEEIVLNMESEKKTLDDEIKFLPKEVREEYSSLFTTIEFETYFHFLIKNKEPVIQAFDAILVEKEKDEVQNGAITLDVMIEKLELFLQHIEKEHVGKEDLLKDTARLIGDLKLRKEIFDSLVNDYEKSEPKPKILCIKKGEAGEFLRGRLKKEIEKTAVKTDSLGRRILNRLPLVLGLTEGLILGYWAYQGLQDPIVPGYDLPFSLGTYLQEHGSNLIPPAGAALIGLGAFGGGYVCHKVVQKVATPLSKKIVQKMMPNTATRKKEKIEVVVGFVIQIATAFGLLVVFSKISHHLMAPFQKEVLVGLNSVEKPTTELVGYGETLLQEKLPDDEEVLNQYVEKINAFEAAIKIFPKDESMMTLTYEDNKRQLYKILNALRNKVKNVP